MDKCLKNSVELLPKSDKAQYEQAIDILTSKGKFYINLGLERIQKILDLMDNPQNKLKFIHVAGTNGKGSVCAMLSAILSNCIIDSGNNPSPLLGEGEQSSDEGELRYKINSMYTNEALEKAKILRKNTTDTEKILWFYLRNRRLCGLKFRRQVPIGKYIVDFVCKEKKIIVEIDGSGHLYNEQRQHDEIRNAFLKAEGYKVLRFYNTDIFNNIETVLEVIYYYTLNPLTPSLSPNGRGGTKLKVGLFTSPHIFEYTERIKINDIEISKEIFAKKIIEIVKLADENQIHLTEFEILTVVAFKYFAENNVDVVILETGLGGRLDATNVIEKNICSIITHIDFDHTERLGDTIEKIATEKAGIIKPNCPVIINKNNAGVNVIKQIAKRQGSKIIYTITPCGREEEGGCSLKGTYQEENLTLALAAIDILNKNGFNITKENIEKGLKNVKHPCRFEYLKEHNILIDGAHNPNGTKALRESLDSYFPNQKFKFIFGCLNNKEYSKMMDNLFTPKDDIYFYSFNNPNSCDYEDLASVCRFASKPFSEYKKENNTLTVVCGSFYMIKELITKIVVK